MWLFYKGKGLIVCEKCLNLNDLTPPHMKNTEHIDSYCFYSAPSIRVIETKLETIFLASNLEPIDGGDNPDIDW